MFQNGVTAKFFVVFVILGGELCWCFLYGTTACEKPLLQMRFYF